MHPGLRDIVCQASCWIGCKMERFRHAASGCMQNIVPESADSRNMRRKTNRSAVVDSCTSDTAAWPKSDLHRSGCTGQAFGRCLSLTP